MNTYTIARRVPAPAAWLCSGLRVAALALTVTATGWSTGAAAADPLAQALETTAAGQRESQDSQVRIDALTEQTRDMVNEYRATMRQADQLEAYVAQIERLVASQKADLDARAAELAGADETRARSLPLLRDMWRALRDFVHLDTPFLASERAQRVADLEHMLDQSSVSLAEKYRRLIEAYQIEADYGRTVEAWREAIDIDGGQRTVDLLKVGRVGLYYLDLDGRGGARWDGAAHAWQALSAGDQAHVARAMRVARKEVPPEWLEVPLQMPAVQP